METSSVFFGNDLGLGDFSFSKTLSRYPSCIALLAFSTINQAGTKMTPTKTKTIPVAKKHGRIMVYYVMFLHILYDTNSWHEMLDAEVNCRMGIVSIFFLLSALADWNLINSYFTLLIEGKEKRTQLTHCTKQRIIFQLLWADIDQPFF